MLKFLKITLITLIFFLFPKSIYAQANFTTDASVNYKIQENGKALVTNTITIRNLTSDFYAKSFILNLSGLTPINIRAAEHGESLPVSVDYKDNIYSLRVDFPESLPGEGEARTFLITYEEETLVTRSGEVWEVIIPKIVNPSSFRQYSLILTIPENFGQAAFISPEPRNTQIDSSLRNFRFLKDDLEKTGITAVFGEFQVYDFELNYHLENTERNEAEFLIAIPPDTSTQKMYYENLNPKPTNIIVDEDGNWLAEYNIGSREKRDVKVTGAVQIFAKPVPHLIPSPTNLLANIKPSQYWQTDDPEIKKLSQELKTPEAIYNFVTNHLSYNLDRVRPEVTRLGAKSALTNPYNAICMEFTDLFIAIARSAGIPAREINGHAYSQNPQIQPLSLVADVLHSWPEYWDEEKGVWVPVDPTWESTSGVDFFNKLDLKHFAFVIHGQNAEKPYSAGSYKLGSDPAKDVFVNFGEIPENTSSDIKISHRLVPSINPIKKILIVEVINDGPGAVYDIAPELIIDTNSQNLGEYIPVLPPFSKKEIKVNIEYGFMATKAPSSVEVRAYRTQSSVPLNVRQVIITHLIAVSAILILIVLSLHTKAWKFIPKKLKHGNKKRKNTPK